MYWLLLIGIAFLFTKSLLLSVILGVAFGFLFIVIEWLGYNSTKQKALR